MIRSTTENTPTLETVGEQFAAWRSNRTKKCEPIPNDLWQAAASLCQTHSISRVCQSLRLSHAELKKRVSPAKTQSAQFMEIDMTCLSGTWQLQCERGDGAKLRLSGTGQPPAVDMLLREFFS